MAQLPAWLRIFKSADQTAPAVDAQVVTTSNSVDLPQGTCLALYVGNSGDVTLVTAAGTVVTFVGVLAGSILPIMARRVNLTNTSATAILALY